MTCHIKIEILYFPHFRSYKTGFLAKNGVKFQNFENSKKNPLDILEIHVVSKFGLIRIKIAASSLSEPHTHIHTYGRTFQYPGTLLYQHTPIVTLPTYLGHNYHVLTSLISPLTNVLLPSASRRLINKVEVQK